MAITSTKPNTTSVVCPASWRVGQTTLRTSRQESLVKPINYLTAGENSATPPPAMNPPASEAVRINASRLLRVQKPKSLHRARSAADTSIALPPVVCTAPEEEGFPIDWIVFKSFSESAKRASEKRHRANQ